MPEDPTESSPGQTDQSAACEVCGRSDAVEIGERKLCVDCYQSCGSCCAGSEHEE